MNIFLFFTKYLYISKKSRTFVPKNKSLSKTMKRLVSIFVICLMALTLHAQRCAVMDFNAANGVSQIDIDGLSAIFATYFTPEGYTAVDRLTIDRALAEEGYQRNHGSEIIFPSAGYQHCDGTVHYEGAYGNYWSQTLNREGEAWFLYLDLDEARVYSGENCNGRSARLVKKQ